MNDACIALALEEIQTPRTAKVLGDRVISRPESEPLIARTDYDETDGSIVVYFAIDNHSYFLSVQIDPEPTPVVRGVSLAAGNECYLICFSTIHPLSSLLAATHLTPTEQWTMEAGGRSSGMTIKTPMPLANRVDHNIAILLNLLEEDMDGIRQLATMASTFIQVHWYGPLQGIPPIHLTPETIQRLAALSVAVDFDLYVG